MAFGWIKPSSLGGLKVWVTVTFLWMPGGGVWSVTVGLLDWSILSVEGIVTAGTCTELVRVVCACEWLVGMAWIAVGC